MTVILQELEDADLQNPPPPQRSNIKKAQRPGLNMVKENLRTCGKGLGMIMTSMLSSEQSMTKLCFGVLKITKLKRHRLLPGR